MTSSTLPQCHLFHGTPFHIPCSTQHSRSIMSTLHNPPLITDSCHHSKTLLLSSSSICATSSASSVSLTAVGAAHIHLLSPKIYSFQPWSICFVLLSRTNFCSVFGPPQHPSLVLPLAFYCPGNSQSLHVSWISNNATLNFFILLPAANQNTEYLKTLPFDFSNSMLVGTAHLDDLVNMF